MSRLFAWVGGASLVLALVAASWVLTPYATLRDIDRAVARGDAQALSKHVDWEAVRLNASHRIKTCMADRVKAPSTGNVGAAIRGVLGAVIGAVMDGALQRVISPEYIAALISTPIQSSSVSSNNPSGSAQRPRTAIEWTDLDRVELWVSNGAGGALVPRLVLNRQALSWRVNHVLFDCPELP